MVSFDRPELSPCLSAIEGKASDEYAEALGIIEAGRDMLAKRPRADMPGFVPCEADLRREAKYVARRAEEERVRMSILAGTKAYDPQ